MKAFLVVVVALTVAVLLAFTVTREADAHAPWTCRHGHTSHVASLTKVHESRYARGFREGGNHYHVYHYWVWTYGMGWDFKGRLVRLCNGTHS